MSVMDIPTVSPAGGRSALGWDLRMWKRSLKCSLLLGLVVSLARAEGKAMLRRVPMICGGDLEGLSFLADTRMRAFQRILQEKLLAQL